MDSDDMKFKHVVNHERLHNSLDELLSEFFSHTDAIPSKTPILELIEWSAKQCNKTTIDHERFS